MPNRLLESSYLARYLLWNAVGFEDHLLFPRRTIEAGVPIFHFTAPENKRALVPLLDGVVAARAATGKLQTADEYLERNGTAAFLVIQHDRLLFEGYYGGYRHESICTSFSVAKSFVSALIGIALHEKLIHDIDEPLTKYLPELKGSHWPAITIRHLISMSSGLAYDRSGFFPWNDQPRIYYSLDIRRLALGARAIEPPGKHFHYNNYNLILLGMILERITAGHVSKYLQEKIWKPLGMEWPATWSMDSQHSGMEKMESGLNARAVDFAKFGRLYMRCGDWNGKQVVPEAWVSESTTPWPDGRWKNYRYLWWIPRAGKGRFMAIGSLGQFIYVAPDKDCILLRFGNGKPKDWQTSYIEMFAAIADRL
jgi:CubicO group peptidase (beta-lactamase class C family)